jgi:hypothetical protein
MSPDLQSPPDASATSLVTGIIHDAQNLVKQQFQLFQHEVRTDLRKTKEAGLMLGVGACFVVAGLVLVALTLAALLQWAVPTLPQWVCYGVSGLPLLVAGAGLIYAGKLNFESFTAIPQESVQALKENMQWIANQK